MNNIFIATPEHLVYQFCILNCRFNELQLKLLVYRRHRWVDLSIVDFNVIRQSKILLSLLLPFFDMIWMDFETKLSKDLPRLKPAKGLQGAILLTQDLRHFPWTLPSSNVSREGL